MGYRGRLTEAARERIREGGVSLPFTALMLSAEEVDNLVVDDVDVNVGSAPEYLIVHCCTPDRNVAEEVIRFTITLDQATAMRLLFASQLDETRLRTTPDTEVVTPPDIDPPNVTGVA